MDVDGMAVAMQTARGGRETLAPARLPLPEPGPDQILVRVHRAAVNFTDERACRTGLNHLSGRVEDLPFLPGGEIAGTRVDTGEAVVALSGSGGFAQYAAVAESAAHPVPAGLDAESALSVFVPGLTAGLLLEVAEPDKGDAVVVSGATGAVGTLLLRLLAARGQRHVVAVASPTVSEQRLRALGATAVLRFDDDLEPALRQAAGDAPIGLVLDSMGGPALEAGVAVLGRHGTLVSYGSSSDVPATVTPRALIPGSRTVTGFWLLDHLDRRERVSGILTDLFRDVLAGEIRPDRPQVFGLPEVQTALAATAERGRTGRVLIDPWRDET
ncbi:zinc-binding alcohol dehydrogenase family protein [Pseudonocardia xishanensis]|uniref:Quinone oxidoreductase n=1 Tax=Pseudonocardia xishanensis TaxID=630995 RepID=A0ABP8RXJ9_9PSEU